METVRNGHYTPIELAVKSIADRKPPMLYLSQDDDLILVSIDAIPELIDALRRARVWTKSNTFEVVNVELR